ncbi:MAG: hypothetical protein R3E66_17850 [bacterium]
MNKSIAVAYSIAGLAVAACLVTVVLVSQPTPAPTDTAANAVDATVAVAEPAGIDTPVAPQVVEEPQVEYVYETASPRREGHERHERHEREEHDDDDD